MPRRQVPIISEETVICQDCLLPFRRIVGSRRILCPCCAGQDVLAKLKGNDEEDPTHAGCS